MDDITNDLMEHHTPINLIDRVGMFSLSCNADGKPEPTIIWIKDSKPVSNHSTMEINSNDGKATGNYECIASNKFGKSPSKAIQVNVIVKPTLKSGFTSSFIIPENTSFNLTCPVESFDQLMNITWTFKGKPINVISDKLKLFSNLLLFPALMDRNEGEYMCELTNEAGKTSAKMNLVVQTAPKITQISFAEDSGSLNPILIYSLVIKDRKSLTMSCEASGKPTPTVYWILNGRNVSETGKIVLTGLQENMSGSYNCVGTNLVGKVSQAVQVVIKTKPKVRADQPTQFQIKENDSLSVECPMENSNSISWFYVRIFIFIKRILIYFCIQFYKLEHGYRTDGG